MPSEEDPLLPTQGTEAPDELRSNSKYAIFRSVGIALVFGSLLVLGFFAIRKEFVPKIWQRTKNSYYENDALEMEDDEYKGRYTATQFISFTINTMGGSAEHGECEGLDVDPKSGLCYLGNNVKFIPITKMANYKFQLKHKG